MTGWWLALFPIVSAVLLGPCLIGARVLGAFDDQFFWYPLLTAAQTGWRQFGQPPLWLPGIFAGIPFAESLGPSVWYPTDLLAWGFGIPPGAFYAWDAWLHFSLAGIGAAWLAGTMGSSPAAGAFAGLCYLTSGHLLGTLSAGIVTFVRGCALVPWILGLALRAARDGQPRSWVAVAMASALLPMGATHQFFAYLVVALPLLVVGETRGRQSWYALSGCAAALGGAAMLSALTVIPGIRAFGLSLRADPGHGWSTMASLSVADLPGFLLPGVWGPGDPLFGPATAVSARYLGLIPFVFCAYATAANWRAAKGWVLLAIVTTLLALGQSTPVGRLFGALPFMASFRVSTRWLIFAQLAVTTLAALGLDSLVRCTPRARNRMMAAWVGIGLVGCSLWLIREPLWANMANLPSMQRAAAARPGTEPAMHRAFDRAFLGAGARGIAAAGITALTGAAPPVALVSAWCALGAVDLVLPALPTLRATCVAPGEVAAIASGFPLPPTRSAPSRIFTEEPHFLANVRVSSGQAWVQGYHGAPLRTFGAFYDAAVYRCPDRPGLFRWFAARWYLTEPRERWHLRSRGIVTNALGQSLAVREDPECMPRAFFAAAVEAAAGDDAALDALCRTPPSARRVMVAGPRGSALAGRKAAGKVASLDITPNRIRGAVESEGDGFVFFSEAWYPAWKGFVDGVRVPVERVNVMFRGIAVGRGTHTVEMVYSSLPFRLGLWISLLCWSALLACYCAIRVARPAAPPQVTEVQGP